MQELFFNQLIPELDSREGAGFDRQVQFKIILFIHEVSMSSSQSSNAPPR